MCVPIAKFFVIDYKWLLYLCRQLTLLGDAAEINDYIFLLFCGVKAVLPKCFRYFALFSVFWSVLSYF